MHYSYSCIDAANENASLLTKTVQASMWRFRIAVFENSFRLFKALYGFTEFALPEMPNAGSGSAVIMNDKMDMI